MSSKILNRNAIGRSRTKLRSPTLAQAIRLSAQRGCALCFGLIIAATILLSPATSLAEVPDKDSGKQFTMMKGRGVAVCEAYLDLLNRTPLERTPFCGRPENGSEPFMHLERQYLDADGILHLFNYVFEFVRFDDQHHVEKIFHPHADPTKPYGVDENKSYWSADATDPDIVSLSLKTNGIHVWTYGTTVDIANDGKPVRLLVWQGYGVVPGGASCGADYASTSWDVTYSPQLIFVLNSDGTAIDEARTRAIFGAQGTRTSLRPPVSAGLPPGAKPFRSLADSIGIFGYEGRYYIQTENKPASRGAAPPPVEVWLHENRRTNEVCAFRPQAVPIPE